MKKVIFLFISIILIATGCARNSIVVQKPDHQMNSVSSVHSTEIVVNDKEMVEKSFFEQEMWNKIKLLYIESEMPQGD
jgi:PBP1b-binding outer membrane lipoprotein LpoB